MSKGLKVVLIVLGSVVALVIGGGFLLWKAKGAEWQAELLDAGSQARTDAAQAGASATKEECVQLALARLRQDSGFMGQVKVVIFTEHCLDAAQGELRFCADAPPQSEILETVAWRLRVSETLGLGDPENAVVKGIQQHCTK